jgi:multiple sugar transport system ATP-binding protein
VTTRAELKRLHLRLNTTTIYVTHDQEEAMTLGDRIVVMKDGKIQQANTPLVTYNSPVNRFVAGFIGMPPMNFFDGTIRMVNGRMSFEEGKLLSSNVAAGANGKGPASLVYHGELTLPGNGFTLSLDFLPQSVKNRLLQRIAGHVVLGIRPEHLHLRPVEGETAAIQVKINVVEPLGSDMDVYMSTSQHDHVVGRLEASSVVQSGMETTVYVDLKKVQFFDPGETGMNLSLETTSPINEPAHAVA